jgi:hypothetical protein
MKEGFKSTRKGSKKKKGQKKNPGSMWDFLWTKWHWPWLRRLVAGLSLQRPGFDSGSVHVGFCVDKMAL